MGSSRRSWRTLAKTSCSCLHHVCQLCLRDSHPTNSNLSVWFCGCHRRSTHLEAGSDSVCEFSTGTRARFPIVSARFAGYSSSVLSLEEYLPLDCFLLLWTMSLVYDVSRSGCMFCRMLMFIFALGLAWSENAIQYDIIIWQPKLRQPPIRLKARTDRDQFHTPTVHHRMKARRPSPWRELVFREECEEFRQGFSDSPTFWDLEKPVRVCAIPTPVHFPRSALNMT